MSWLFETNKKVKESHKKDNKKAISCRNLELDLDVFHS